MIANETMEMFDYEKLAIFDNVEIYDFEVGLDKLYISSALGLYVFHNFIEFRRKYLKTP
mgnify:CR=1 FL=1